ncbi:hypothetical protein [Yeosuana marina]|uniref:hypothetical protein n=2 Tax=Yeosuana marina TaxID=1565536 RepID=UPI00142292E1|nr:hypothetical protein [Yeosuana marina]
MNIKITLLSICFLLVTAFSFSQRKDDPKSIMNKNVAIKKYHSTEDLEKMQKGELLELYLERMTTLTNTLPYIAFGTKPNVTMSSVGIPESKENVKALEKLHENTENYLDNTIEFQKIILPYSDTNNLAKAILFYEEIIKSFHTYEQFM